MAAWQPFVFYDKKFSKSECETIIHASRCIRPEVGATSGGENPLVRKSEVRWMKNTKSHRWVFDRLAEVAVGACGKDNWYPFHLSCFAEPIQITHYKGSDEGHYDTHQDFGPGNMSTRKLSLVVLLNDPAEFKGGELELLSIPGENKAIAQLAQGTVIAFPSWELHRVRKLTEGERWSLVCWVHGNPFI